MECAICKVRSAAGYCAVCRVLLCEKCGSTCAGCGKRSCPTHTHESAIFATFCAQCHAEQERRESRNLPARARADQRNGPAPSPTLPVARAPDRRGVVTRWTSLPPWKMCLATALAGLFGMILLTLIPALQRMPLPGERSIPSHFIVMALPALAFVWGLVGLIKREYEDDRARLVPGLLIAVMAAFAGFALPGSHAGAQDPPADDKRVELHDREVRDLRRSILEKYAR